MSSPYINQPQYTPPAQPSGPTSRSSGLATAGMIVGIASIFTFGCAFGIVGIVAVILSSIALAQICKSGGLVTGKGRALTGLILGIVTIVVGIGFFVFMAKNASRPQSPFVEAQSKIVSDRSREIGHGNTPEATEIAKQIAIEMKSIRDIAIDGEESKFSLSGGKFLTFVQLNAESAGVTIHVPNLRNYEEDAKQLIAEAAWAIVQIKLAESQLPDQAKLVVATKGYMLFDKIYSGKHIKNFVDVDEDGITNHDAGETSLRALFPDRENQAEKPELSLDREQ